ncbi:MAG: hypothetical protein JO132_09845 [Streptosporangiaceae bacterium]|nr:hypothetical protein [Streptosporangiaceae bacterium]
MNTTSWAVRARGLGVSGRTAAVTKAIETGALPAPGWPHDQPEAPAPMSAALLGAGDSLDHRAGAGAAGTVAAVRAPAAVALRAEIFAGSLGARGRLITWGHSSR